MQTRIFVVADLGFGDSGKGTIVDYLARAHGANLVVRWNGGAQAGHAVITDDGREHVFAQFGAATFVPNVRTHLAEPFVLHPTALLVEARYLAQKGVGAALDRLTIAESARIITPFHQAANRLRELGRGDGRHGTCGIGIGETVRDSLEASSDEIIVARDLVCERATLRSKLERVRDRMHASLARQFLALHGDVRARDEIAIFDDSRTIRCWLEAVEPLRKQPSLVVENTTLDRRLRDACIVLEGAQGVLLDQSVGFHPHTTWSDCTTKAATTLLAEHGVSDPERIDRIGVMRAYLTRHGAGPFPSESAELGVKLPERHNESHGWQGRFRVGFPDMVLMRYALRMSGGVDSLALTHADRIADLSKIVTAYENAADSRLFMHDTHTRAIDLREGDLAHQERLGTTLSKVHPMTESLRGDEQTLVNVIEQHLHLPVGIVSSGPKACHKREIGRDHRPTLQAKR
ncbi:MAG: adenylosuccinate synthetase [Polyangiaceae bacterium]|nr:adenylosuccinate synthetase [Polyangiaceae bacterium]